VRPDETTDVTDFLNGHALNEHERKRACQGGV
jgi:hypothetical protein